LETKISHDDIEFDLKKIPRAISFWGFIVMVMTSLCTILYTHFIKVPISYDCKCESYNYIVQESKKNHPFEEGVKVLVTNINDDKKESFTAVLSAIKIQENHITFQIVDEDGIVKECLESTMSFENYSFFDLVVSQF